MKFRHRNFVATLYYPCEQVISSCRRTVLSFSRVGNLRKGPYFARKKNPSVIWILNSQSPLKCSIGGTIFNHSSYRHAILRPAPMPFLAEHLLIGEQKKMIGFNIDLSQDSARIQDTPSNFFYLRARPEQAFTDGFFRAQRSVVYQLDYLKDTDSKGDSGHCHWTCWKALLDVP